MHYSIFYTKFTFFRTLNEGPLLMHRQNHILTNVEDQYFNIKFDQGKCESLMEKCLSIMKISVTAVSGNMALNDVDFVEMRVTGTECTGDSFSVQDNCWSWNQNKVDYQSAQQQCAQKCTHNAQEQCGTLPTKTEINMLKPRVLSVPQVKQRNNVFTKILLSFFMVFFG